MKTIREAVRRLTLPVMAVLSATVVGAYAQDAKVDVHGVAAKGKMQESSGPSPVGGIDMVQAINPKSPPMTKDEFEAGKKIYFERCAGCHGVLRKGATGKALTTDITIDRGSEYLRTFINYGSAGGMPNWGTSGTLSEKEVDIMTRYVQHEPPMPPEYGIREMEATWKVLREAAGSSCHADEQARSAESLLGNAA